MDYSKLRMDVLQLCNENENIEKIIARAKDNYFNVINSRRKLEKINSLNCLLNILEKRAELSPENIEPLLYISSQLPNAENVAKILNSYKLQNSNPEAKNSQIDNNEEKMARVHGIVLDEIGTNWRNLARYLKVKEEEIKIIDEKYGNDLRSKICNILKIFQENNDPTKHVESLCNALEKCRRKDLKNKILKIL